MSFDYSKNQFCVTSSDDAGQLQTSCTGGEDLPWNFKYMYDVVGNGTLTQFVNIAGSTNASESFLGKVDEFNIYDQVVDPQLLSWIQNFPFSGALPEVSFNAMYSTTYQLNFGNITVSPFILFLSFIVFPCTFLGGFLWSQQPHSFQLEYFVQW
jgi:hypothetical protein